MNKQAPSLGQLITIAGFALIGLSSGLVLAGFALSCFGLLLFV